MTALTSDLLTEPVETVRQRATALSAARSWAEFDPAAQKAFRANEAQMIARTQESLNSLKKMGINPRPFSPGLVGRLFDRALEWFDDWRYRRNNPDADTDEGASSGGLLPASIPLAQTHPYQDMPFAYDEIDSAIDALIADLAALISAQPHWTEVSFTPPEISEDAIEADDWDNDTTFAWELSQTRHIWQDAETGTALILQHIEEPDAKIMGTQLTIGFEEGRSAARLLGKLNAS